MRKVRNIFLICFAIIITLLFIIFSNNFKKINSVSSTFIVTSLGDNELVDNGKLHYDYHFTTQSIELSLDSKQKKELKVRIKQTGNEIDAAHIDYLALKFGNLEIAPDKVIDLDNQNDILFKVLKLDNDIVDVRGHTIEATWKNVNEDKVFLVMNAREEDLETLPGIPFVFPPNLNLNQESTFIEYNLKNNGKIIVDGKIDESDNLYEPAFSFYTVPVTGHPVGYVYFYIKNDTPPANY